MRAARTDSNQRAITEALRQLGAFVEPRLSRLGGGIPDLLVLHRGRTFLVELKDGTKPRCERELTPAEHVWHIEAKAIGGVTVQIWTSLDEAIDGLGLQRERE